MEYNKNDEIYSKVVRAGKRTYFFDVKATRGRELYITITESKKTFVDGRESYQKHKLFLYKEDFEKFKNGFEDVIDKIAELNTTGEYRTEQFTPDESFENSSSTDISFDDL